ncbi:MAG: hypothetical protein LBM99_02490 [Bacillales bacterium]|nr:hypothetical protein [Bacillales bacterium]
MSKFMRFRRFLVFIVFGLVLSGCGYDTRGWPNLEVPFLAENLSKIELIYEDGASVLNRTLSQDKQISWVISQIGGFPYKKTTENKNDRIKFACKLIINFFDSLSENKILSIAYYEYRIADGKVFYSSGEVYFITGNFILIFERTPF